MPRFKSTMYACVERSPGLLRVLLPLWVLAVGCSTPSPPASPRASLANPRVDPKDGEIREPSIPRPKPRGNPLRGMKFWVDPHSLARLRANALATTDPQKSALIAEKIASRPTAVLLGVWNADIFLTVDAIVSAAAARSEVPILVTYNIPSLDCSQPSAGYLTLSTRYRRWIRRVAAAIGDRAAVVVLEKDAVSMLEKEDCLSEGQRQDRVFLLRDAIRVLRQRPNTVVYLDSGHSRWLPVETYARLLKDCGVDEAHGFALNLDNYRALSELLPFGQRLSEMLGGAHFVIDTSRNGAGPLGVQWCNPAGRKLGVAPTLDTALPSIVDAYLWLKRPGESDGACNGAPRAGTFTDKQALELLSP